MFLAAVPALAALIPLLARNPIVAANVSIETPAAVAIGAPSLTDSNNSETLTFVEFAVKLITSITRFKPFIFFVKSSLSRPKAPIASDAISAASAKSISAAVAKSTISGNAFIENAALKPALAKKFKPFAACVAVNSVVAPTRRAVSSSALNSLVPRFILSGNLAAAEPIARPNSAPDRIRLARANPIPTSDAVPIVAARLRPLPNFFTIRFSL